MKEKVTVTDPFILQEGDLTERVQLLKVLYRENTTNNSPSKATQYLTETSLLSMQLIIISFKRDLNLKHDAR